MLVSAFWKNNFIINVVHVLLLMDNYVAVNSIHYTNFSSIFLFLPWKYMRRQKRINGVFSLWTLTWRNYSNQIVGIIFFLHVKLCRAFVETIQKWKIKIALRKSNSPWYLTSTTRSLFTCYGISNFNLTK